MILKANNLSIEKAAEIIKLGGIVAFPTETVYGLGANAFNEKAVAKIFLAKGRPSDNPLIVHISSSQDDILGMITRDIPAIAGILIKKFWPGALTLILKKRKIIPNIVSGGLDTVAVRMPNNKTALKLIETAGTPIAAPSANISGRPSGTDAQTVFEDFGNNIDLILDGGPTKIGVESTVIDLTVSPPTILRQGGVTVEEIRDIIPKVAVMDYSKPAFAQRFGVAKAPGMKYRHYAPKARLVLVDNILEYLSAGGKTYAEKNVGILTTKENLINFNNMPNVISMGSRKNLKECSHNLFTCLRKFDKLEVSLIICETFPKKGLGAAIMERLEKAAESNPSYAKASAGKRE